MIEGSGEDALLEHFVSSQRAGIGRFTADPDTDRWAWNSSLDEILGSTADAVAPSWDLIFERVPEHERAVVEEAYRLASSRVGPFSWSHRILTADGQVRSVLVIGETTSQAAGEGGPMPAPNRWNGACAAT